MEKTESGTTFKERLANEMSYQGFSNKSFAEKIGISINTLNIYLYRNSIPSADIAVKMADALNTTVEFLITGKSPNDRPSWQKSEITSIANSLTKNQLSAFLKIARAYKEGIHAEEDDI